MANINKIRLSGQTYNIEDSNATKTISLTQAEYDALVSGGTVDPNAFYVITDAQGADLSQYWTSAQTQSAITQATTGQVDTSTFNTYSGSVDTALSGKQDTLSAGTGIDITNNVISATGGGGGGKAIEAGTNISVTTGETADTINCTIPILVNDYAIVVGYQPNAFNKSSSDGEGAVAFSSGSLYPANNANGVSTFAHGQGCSAQNVSHSEGRQCISKANYSHAEGQSTTAGTNYNTGTASHSEGSHTFANGNYSHAEGLYTTALNHGEHSQGEYNISNTGSTDADKTLFSVGNGTADNARHNAFEIRKNGDIYITSGASDIKLQDYLGGVEVSSAITSGDTNAVAGGAVYDKFDEVEQVTAAGLNALNDLLDEKLDVTAYTPTDLSNYYTKSQTSGASEIQNALDDKVDYSTYSAYTASTQTVLNGKLDTSSFNTYTASTDARLAEDEEVTARALNYLNDRIIQTEATIGDINTILNSI